MLRWLTLTALLAAACGDDDGTTPTCDNASDGMCPSGCSMDPDCAPDDGGPPEDTGGTDDNGVLYDDIYEGTCIETPRCEAGFLETACVCVTAPRTAPASMPDLFDIKRVACAQLSAGAGGMRNPEDDFCDAGGGGDGNLGCNMPGMYRESGESRTVTVYGVVDVFGNGGDADAINVEIYAEGADGALGELLGSATASIDDPCAESEDEIDNDMVIGTRELGFFAIGGIPAETPVIIKTSGNPDFWRDIYSYNVQAIADEIETGAIATGSSECDSALAADARFMDQPRWEYRARILSSSDWTSIPLTAGLVEGIRTSSGAVAGEVHDCDDIRLEFSQVATVPAPEVLTYFTDNPDNPLPAPSRTEGTSLLGLYAALDIPAGPVDVAAVGRVGSDVVSLGWYRARVFAGAITTVTLRGLRPQQTP